MRTEDSKPHFPLALKPRDGHFEEIDCVVFERDGERCRRFYKGVEVSRGHSIWRLLIEGHYWTIYYDENTIRFLRHLRVELYLENRALRSRCG